MGKKPNIVLVNRCMIFDGFSKFLLIKRSKYDEHCPGKWEFPGGKLDEGQDLSHALEREVMEETGLFVYPSNRIAYIESEIINSGKYKGFTYILIAGIGKLIGGKLLLSAEHDEYKWVDYSESLNMDLKDNIRKAIVVLKSQR